MLLHCPYCDAKSNFKNWWNSQRQQNAGEPTYSTIVHAASRYIYKCDNCGDFVFIRSIDDKIMDIYPFQEVSSQLEGVPKPILDDYHEAHRCFGASANKGSAAMCRRALQGAAIKKGATAKKKLVAQLKELQSNGTLHESLYDLATHIRLIGNTGAHPGEDGLDKVTKEEADKLLEFTKKVLDYLFVMPHQIAALKPKESNGKGE